MELEALGRPGAAPRRWAFAVRAPFAYGRDAVARLRAGLETVLRAGHGLGARFVLEFEGGPGGRVCLTTECGASGLWAERELLSVYDPGAWQPAPGGRSAPPCLRWQGRRPTLPTERGARVPEHGRLAEALAAALRGSGRTAFLSVRLRPVPLARAGLLDRLWPGTAAAPRAIRVPGAGRGAPPATSPEAARVPVGPCWEAAIDLSLAPGASSGGGDAVVRAVRSAWTVLDGAPLHLRSGVEGGRERFPSLFSEPELIALLPAVELVGAAPPEPPRVGDRLPLGRAAAGDMVGLPVEPAQGRHFAVLGETGMGKSSLLLAIALRAPRWGGVIVLDPLGETAEAVRRELVASGRRPLWIAPGAPGAELNALAVIGSALPDDPVRAERGVEGLVHALRRVRAGRFADSAYWGPRLEEMLARAIRSAAAVPGGTLEDAHALLSMAGSSRSVVPPAARVELRELEARVRDRPEDAEGARRLLYEVVRNPTLARMLCSREPRLTVADLVGSDRAVVVSGAAGEVGESTARYLLGTYLALLWSELLSRRSLAKTFVLLDEAQWFAHEGLAEMLRLARRRNVHVGVATQSLASLPEGVRDAMLTNVADTVVFRGSPEGARDLARTHPGLSPEGLLGLARGEAVVLLGKGESIRWIRTARLPEPGAVAPGTDRVSRGTGATAGGVPTGSGLLATLGARTAGRAPGELVRVDLGELRRSGTAREHELRALGSELGRRRAIVRSERGPGGPVWWVEPEGLARALTDLVAESPRAPSDSP